MSEIFQYDAFISYSHNKRDAAIAQALHRQLEHYRIPRSIRIRYGKKKISRVFRDKEELGLSASLSDEICEALDHSEFLILICSPESRESYWVNQELEFFLRKHSKEQVLTILLAGEPKDVFPPILCTETVQSADEAGHPVTSTIPVEPLAADLRCSSIKESLKKLKTEKLRIISHMLGCPYDRLKQRHREYIIKRTAAWSACALALLLIFLGYSQHQKRQIALNKRHSLKLQAEYQARQSLEALKAGNRKQALDNALFLPDPSEKNVPYTNQQLYALNNALYSYKSKYIKDYAPESITDVTRLKDGSFSEDGTYYYAVNENYEGFIFSGKTGQMLNKIDTGPVEKNISDNPEKYADSADGMVHGILPYGKKKCLVLLSYAACIMDSASGKIEKIFPTPSANFNCSSSRIEKNKLLLSTEEGSIDLYDLKTGRLSYTSDVYGKYDSMYFLSFDGAYNGKDKLAAGASWETEEKSDKGPGGLWIFDCQDNTSQKLSDIQVTDMEFIDESHIAVIHKELPALQKRNINLYYFTYYLAVYDVNSGKQLYTGEKVTSQEVFHKGLMIHQKKKGKKAGTTILHWLNANLVVTDYESGTCCGQLTFDDFIVNVEKMEPDSVLVATESGWFQEVTLTDSLNRYDRLTLNASPETMHYNRSSDKMACIIKGKLAIFSRTYDKKMKEINVADQKERSIEKVDYLGEGKNVFRCVLLEDSSSLEDVEAKIYALHSDHCLYHFVCEEDGYNIEHMECYEYNGESYLNLIEAGPDDEETMPSTLHIINLSKETEVKKLALPARKSLADQLRYNKDHSRLFLYDGTFSGNFQENCLYSYYITENAVKEASVITFPGAINGWEKLNESDCLLVSVREDEHTCKLLKYDSSSGKTQPLDTRIPFSLDGNLPLVTGKITDRIAFFDGEKITVLDGEGQILMQTEKLANVDSYTVLDFGFFNQDKQLLVTYDNTVFMYDVATGTIQSTLAIDTSDDLLDQSPHYSLITDSSNSFFALKNMTFLSDYTRLSSKYLLLILSVDENMEMAPYAEVMHGYISLSGEEVSLKNANLLEYTKIYDYNELTQEAKKLLSD